MARSVYRWCAGTILAGTLALTGCQAPVQTDPGTGSDPGTGGAAVVGVTSDPDTLMPWKATQFQAVNVLQNVYGTLTEYDKDLNTVPGLAESWEASADGTKLTLRLRQGVTFADGTDFDATDVKFSLDGILDEANAAVGSSTLSSVTKVAVVDPQTVELSLSAPDAALPSGLATVNLAMLSSEDDLGVLETEPNGTGPFSFDSRTPSQAIRLKRNDAYWGDKAKLASVEFRVIPDENAIVTALQSGNVNLAVINDPLVAQTAEGGTLTVAKTPQLSYHALQLRTQGVLADKNVRLAVQCGIDRQQVLDTAAFGEGEVVGPITAPAYKSDPNARPCPTRDIAKAKDYLAKAGKSDGVTIQTIVSQGEYATSVSEAQNLKSQLAEVGITLELEILESGAFVDRWVAADFEAAVALNVGRPDPESMYGRYFTSTGNLNKVAGYNSPELDALFAKGKATDDQAERQQIYTQVSKELEDNAAWVWTFTGYTYTATTQQVSGFQPMVNGSLQSLRTTTVG
ncbi:MAG: ABC transporter substrate-binding protein [Propionibacteriales bacterium]|nr:ABC transporter substrate-binding protein [Propionibacteriales bacterium]